MSWAKGLGGGFPIGAAWIRKRPVSPVPDAIDLCDVLGPGSHGTTYGGSPLACAVSLAVLQEIKDSRLCENSATTGARIMATVASWQHPLIHTIRGLGLLIGFELDPAAMLNRTAYQEADGFASIYLVKALMAEGLLTVAAGPLVVRLTAALDEFDLAAFQKLLAEQQPEPANGEQKP